MKGKAAMHAIAPKKVPANQAFNASVQCDVALTWIIVSEASHEEQDEFL